ncbi:MAG: RHS repeat-associated core domain-containing protein [Chloroflexota bacterium]|nr:RHS repeat-associated core domain-containing protein [Chloroflexota bacterium]
MIVRKHRLNLILTLLIIASLLSTSLSLAAPAGETASAPLPEPVSSPPPGRNGLGLGRAENGNPADIPVQMVDGVNVTNGNLLIGDIHFQFNGQGPTFALQPVYNSQADPDLSLYTPLGRKWTHNLNDYITFGPEGDLALHKGDGEVISYPLTCRQDVNRSRGQIDVIDIQLTAEHWNTALGDPGFEAIYDVEPPPAGDGQVNIRDIQVVAAAFNSYCYQVDPAYWLWEGPPADAIYSEIVALPSGDFELHTREGLVKTFFSPLIPDPIAGKLQSVLDRNGSGYVLNYAPDGLLMDAGDTSGNTLQFSYDMTVCPMPVIEQVSDHTGREVNYLYDNSSCDLISVSRYGVPWRDYAYQFGTSLLMQQADAMGATTEYDYDADSRLMTLRLPDTSHPQAYGYPGPGITHVMDAIGRLTEYHYSPMSKIQQIVQAATGHTIAYVYDGRGNLAHLGGPDGNDYGYDERGNLLRIESAHPDPADPTRLETLFTYDACNQVRTTTDAMGRTTENVYDPATCHLETMIDPMGHATQFVNNSQGQPVEITDAAGRVTTNVYDPNGNLIQTEDNAGNITHMGYDLLNRRIEETDAAGHLTTFQYDDFDRQTRIIAPPGPGPRETVMVYDNVGNLVTSVNPDGNATGYGYDGRGNKLSVTDSLGNVTRYEYDDPDRLMQVTDPMGRITRIDYDALNRPITVTANTTALFPQITELSYDDPGLTRRVTNANGHTTTFELDRAGRVLRVTNPDGTIATQYEYNLAGEMLSVVDALGRIESSEYDDAGRKITDTDARSFTTGYEYDAVGNVISVSNARGYITQVEYDHGNRITAVHDPLGGVTQMDYDELGNLLVVTDPDSNATNFGYDETSNLITVTNPLNEITLLEYSAAGQRTALESPEGLRIEFDLDSLGRVLTERKLGSDGLLAEVSFQYDAMGNRFEMIDANGFNWNYDYDDYDRLIGSTDPLGNTTGYEYDPLGNLMHKSLPDGTGIAYSYDDLNRLGRTDYADGSYVSQLYDAMGNVEKVESFAAGGLLEASTDFDYNERNQVIQVSGLISPTLSYGIDYHYDEVGNPHHKEYILPDTSGPIMVEQLWDENNRLVTITRTEGLATAVAEKDYSPAGQLVGSKFSSEASLSAFSSYGRDPAGRLQSIQHCWDLACSTLFSQYDYSYDQDGNRTSELVTKDGLQHQIEYEFDGLNRLSGERRLEAHPPGLVFYDTTYSYDPVGNRISETDGNDLITYVHNAAGQIELKEIAGALDDTILYIHDDNGNLVHRESLILPPPAGVLEDLEYDAEGRLVSYWEPAVSTPTVYTYDGLGNKIYARDAILGDGKAYLYDGPNVVAEYAVDSLGIPSLESTYLFGQEIDEALARFDPSMLEPSFYLRDALGSTRQIIDPFGGVWNDYEYTAFGELFAESGTLPNDILFTGRWRDPASDLYDFRTRVYDPDDGRFLQKDPIYEGLILAPCVACWQNPLELFEVMPLYGYVGNNPATYTDPTGEQWWFWRPWWWLSGPVDYVPYAWWGWWYSPWGWAGLRWWWWRWWWPANPFWGGWWWWQWRWWWGGWWLPYWGNAWWPWWWGGNWWWWPWSIGWGWWWYPWWWGGWWWPWWWFNWRGWWHWHWWWPLKWAWWCGWWWRWWWPWWWGGRWWPWFWSNWTGWRLGFWLGMVALVGRPLRVAMVASLAPRVVGHMVVGSLVRLDRLVPLAQVVGWLLVALVATLSLESLALVVGQLVALAPLVATLAVASVVAAMVLPMAQLALVVGERWSENSGPRTADGGQRSAVSGPRSVELRNIDD